MLTYIDSSILLTAWRGTMPKKIRALTVLKERGRIFACSPYVEIELIPKAAFHKQATEVEFYQAYFASVRDWVRDCNLITEQGFEIAVKYGMAALDAMHIAAALHAGAQEFVTAERPTSPFNRVEGIRIINIV